MSVESRINKQVCSSRLRVDYAHVGLYDVGEDSIWIVRKKLGVTPIRVSHARMIVGGTQDTSTAAKDRFVCFWYHTPGTGQGYVHGYPIEWDEGHLMIRLDPNWDYARGRLIPEVNAAQVERNIDQQYAWGRRLFNAYVEKKPTFAISWHMIGRRAADSMFYIQRVEPGA